MGTNILIVTPDVPFGELIRQSMEETGRFKAHVAWDGKKAAAFLRETDCSLAFLDAGDDSQEMLTIGQRLREIQPDLRFIAIAEADRHPVLEELSPEKYLSKPFYLPDLLETIDNMFPESKTLSLGKSSKAPAAGSTPPWLADVSRAAQHLTRLTLESAAQAALITSSDQLWAYAGQLPQSAARELADTVSRYWDQKEENDLVRFVRLASTDAEHMLYATRLAAGMVLALVFDAETPFSTIRTQASQLVHSLSASPAEVKNDGNFEEDEIQLASLANILSDVPPPNPSMDLNSGVGATGPDGTPVPSTVEDPDADAGGQEIGLVEISPYFSRESSPAMPRDLVLNNPEQAETRPHLSLQTEDELAVTVKSKATKKAASTSTEAEPGEVGARPGTESGRKIVLEPVSASVYNLDYACLLVPRFPHHYLTGDLSGSLGIWVSEICIAFGWRLEYISIRPEYLQWIVNVPPSTSPGNLMRILRHHTSERIFTDFQRYRKENPSGDFWAPGYLIMGGSQPPPTQLIKDFIAQTRQRQGISQRNQR
jgi:REP element-mobilizing transposase RayT/DNA-binding response OmpR family regulator